MSPSPSIVSQVEHVAAVVAATLVGVWRRWGRADKYVAVLGMLGAACVGFSLLPGPGPDAAWLRDFLMTVGSSVALFAPFYLITRSLDRHLDRVTAETAQQVEEVRSEAAEASTALTGQVEALRADVDRRMGDVADRVAARLEAEATADRQAFAALRADDPSREAVWEALERAQRLGLISYSRPPRVNISGTSARLYASVELDTDELADEPLRLRVEDLSGSVQDWIPWDHDQDTESVLVEVGRALYKHTGEDFDARLFLDGLADLLDAASVRSETRPAVELCPPQWVVCDWGVTTYDSHVYGVNLKNLLSSKTVQAHVSEKGWVDVESWDAAYEAAAALFQQWYSPDPWADPDGNAPF